MTDSELRPIRRLLVANRGEIARRVFRTAHSMGISTVAVYAEGDAEAPFVTDADLSVPLGGRTGHFLDVAGATDIARVEPQAANPALQGGQSQSVLEVDVGDYRHRAAGNDLRQPLGGLHGVAGDPHQVGACSCQGIHLRQGAVHVMGLGGGHRLHGDRGIASDLHRSNLDCASAPSRTNEGAGVSHNRMGSITSSTKAATPRNTTSTVTTAAMEMSTRGRARRFRIFS